MDLEKDSIYKLMLNYCLPAVIGMMSQTVYNLIDKMFVGHIKEVGYEALAGIGVTLPITTLILGIGLLFGTGSRAKIAILLGKNDIKKANQVLGEMFFSTLIFGIIITSVLLIFIKQFLYLFGATTETFSYAKSFIEIILIFTPINLLGFTLNKIISSDGNPKKAMLIQVFGTVLNIILDYVLILKFNLGVKGAAIATVTAQMFVFTFCSYYFLKDQKRKLTLKLKNIKFNFKSSMQIMNLGFSQFFMQILMCIMQIIINKKLVHYGNYLDIGTMTIIQSILLFLIQPIYGVNQGVTPLIGYNFGRKNNKRVVKILKISIFISVIWTSLGLFVVEVFPTKLILLFSSNIGIKHNIVFAIRVFFCMIILDGIQITVINFYQAIGNAKISSFLSTLRQGIVLIPFLLVFPYFFGINGIWYSVALADFISFVVTYIVCRKKLSSSINIA